MNYKYKISKGIVAIFLLLFAFGGCKKSETVLGEKNFIIPDASITQNNTYGNWIKFENMEDFRRKAEEIKYIYIECQNPDSILDKEEAVLG